MVKGKLIYPSGDPAAITYVFPRNFSYGHGQGYLETDDNQRAFDGTLNSYAGPRKKIYELTFTRVTKAQADYFLTLWTYQCPMDLYLDGVNLDATVKMMTPPLPKSEAAFVAGAPAYSFDVRFEEI
jgi:hypothetical protein